MKTIVLSLCLYRQQNMIEPHTYTHTLIHKEGKKESQNQKKKNRRETHYDLVRISLYVSEEKKQEKHILIMFASHIRLYIDMRNSNKKK